MRRPKRSELTEDDGTFDEDGFDEVMGTYEDEEYDRYRDEQDDIGDQIHEQRRDEKDEVAGDIVLADSHAQAINQWRNKHEK